MVHDACGDDRHSYTGDPSNGERLRHTKFCSPSFNEADNLESLVAAADQVLRTVTENYELIIVDDGSTDRTKEVVKCLSPRYPQLQVIHHAQNHGYGAALVTGFKNCQKDLI